MGVFTAKIQQCNAVCLLGTKTVSYLSVGAGSSFQEGGSSHDGEGQTAWTCGGAQQDTGTSGNTCKQHNTQFKHLHTHNLFHNHFFPSPPLLLLLTLSLTGRACSRQAPERYM